MIEGHPKEDTMSNAKPNDNDTRYEDTADAKQDDELSTDELDQVAGGAAAARPEAMAGRGLFAAGPEAVADGKGLRGLGPEKSA